MKTRQLRLFAAALALGCSVGAHAQQEPAPRELPLDRTEVARLRPTDPRLSQRGPFHVYRVELEQGQRLVVAMESKDFDSYLVIGRLVAGIFDSMAQDDDGGEGNNARLRFRAPESGVYLVLAQALGQTSSGAYALRASEPAEPTTGGVTDIAIGATVEGVIAETDLVDETSGTNFDLYRVQARAGQRLEIILRSGSFDTHVGVGIGSEEAFIERAGNDDAGGELGANSRLRYRVTEDGELLIRARPLSGAAVGPYVLSVAEAVVRPPQPPRPMDPGAEMTGEISDNDEVMQDGRYYHEFHIDARAGQTLVVTHRSTEFDAYLMLGRGEGAAFNALESNDDGGNDGVNSRIEFRVPADGRYVIRATTLSSGAMGRYTLRADVQE